MWHVYLGFLVLSVVGAASADGYFNNPARRGPSEVYDANQKFSLGSEENIAWITSFTSYKIILYQQSLDQASAMPIESIYNTSNGDGAGTKSFVWKVQLYESDLTLSNIYFLWLQPDLSTDFFTCHYFDVIKEEISSSSSSSFSSTISSTSASLTSTGTTTTTGPPSTSTSSAPRDSTNNSDSGALKIGLGVGIGVGMPLVLIAGIWIGLKIFKQRKSSAISSDDMALPFQNTGSVYQREIYEISSRGVAPAELRG